MHFDHSVLQFYIKEKIFTWTVFPELVGGLSGFAEVPLRTKMISFVIIHTAHWETAYF